MWQYLEDNVAVTGAEPPVTQCRQAQSVRSVVGKIEPTFERVACVLRVLETG
jgi:hypothetical protein